MPDKKKSILPGIAFAVVAVLACLLFAVYGQMNTSTVMFGILFQRDGISNALEQDEEWVGTQQEQAQRLSLSEDSAQWLDSHEMHEGEYTTKSAAENFVNSEVSLGYRYWDMGTDKTAILLHGYEMSWEDAAVWARLWGDAGWNVLIPVMRGYAGAASSTTAAGWHEQYDIYDLIVDVGMPRGATSFVLHGEGVGANAALFLSGNERLTDKLEDAGARLELIVADSAYTYLDSLLKSQLDRQFSMGGFLSMYTMSVVINQKLGVKTEDMDATLSVSRSQTPTLFITGAENTIVPAEMTQALFDACSAEKRLLLVPGARHHGAYAADPEAYENEVLDMLG